MQNVIEMRQRIREEITPERIILELADIGFGEREFPEYSRDGEELMQKPPVTVRLKALELVGKSLAHIPKEDGDGVLSQILAHLNDSDED